MINETDFLNDLDEFLEKELAKELDIKADEEGNFLINDASQADYFIRLSKKCIEETEQIDTLIEDEKRRYLDLLNQFANKQKQAIQKRKEFYDRALEDYARREAEKTNKKTIKLPHGVLAIKKQQPHYNYDENVILEWAQANYPEFVKVSEPKYSIDKKEIKKRLLIDQGVAYLDGQIVPGLNIEELDDSFSIK